MRTTVLPLLLLAACGDNATTPAPSTLTWSACGPLGPEGTDGECARMTVPLQRGDSSRTIDVTAKRFGTGTRDQLWILDGGPGGTGAVFDNAGLIQLLDEAGWDVYLFVHRGTGGSTPLVCGSATAADSPGGALVLLEETTACIGEVTATWGDGLAGFSAGEAARDLAAWIDATRTPGTRVTLWGGSYGTYLAQRYLQLEPASVDAVVLEGAVDLTTPLSEQLAAAEAAGERWFEACDADAACAKHLGMPARTAFDRATAVIAGKQCAPVADLDVTTWKQLARALVDTTVGYDARALLAALVHRIDRCSAADAEVLARLAPGVVELAAQLDRDDGDLARNNFLLGINETRIDLWPATTDHAAELAAHDALRFSSGAEWVHDAEVIEAWPRGARSVAADAPATPTMPILVLSGALDTATPLAWGTTTAARYSTATHVVFPYGGHGVSVDDALYPCALPVMLEFLATGHAEQPTCADDRPIAFATAGTARELALDWLGTEDIWGD